MQSTTFQETLPAGFFGELNEAKEEVTVSGGRWTGNSWVEWSSDNYLYKFYYNEWSENGTIYQTLIVSTGTKEEGITLKEWSGGESLRYGREYAWTFNGDSFSLYTGESSYYYITGNISVAGETNTSIENIEFNYKNGAEVGSDSLTSVGAVVNKAYNLSMTNVRSSGATVLGKTFVGGLVGYMNGRAIWNCYNFNDVQINRPSSNECAAGGLVGHAESVNFGYYESNKNGNYGNINISGSGYAGGVIGNSVNCRINYAYNIGNVSSNTFAGGLIGYYSMAYAGANNETLCSHLYNYGIVTSGNCAGGVIGYGYFWNDANEDLQHLFNFGTVKADAGDNSNIDIFAGGIVGAIKVVSTNTISIKYSGNEGSVSGIGKRWVGVGGIVGAHIYSFDEVGGSADTAKNGGSVLNCYNSGNLLCANLNNVDGYVGGIAGGNVAKIENCSMTGKITIRDDETFGWIMGSAWGGATINNCYAEPSTVVVEEKGTEAKMLIICQVIHLIQKDSI